MADFEDTHAQLARLREQVETLMRDRDNAGRHQRGRPRGEQRSTMRPTWCVAKPMQCPAGYARNR